MGRDRDYDTDGEMLWLQHRREEAVARTPFNSYGDATGH